MLQHPFIPMIAVFRAITVFLASLVCLAEPSHAASDTNVTILQVEKVVIEEDKVTIVAEAQISVIAISGNHDPAYGGETYLGRPSGLIKIKSDKATFIIKRSEVSYNDPDGTHAEEKKKYQKAADNAWKRTLEQAKILQEGGEVGRIGYYQPDIVIKGSLIVSIDGRGYLYPKGK